MRSVLSYINLGTAVIPSMRILQAKSLVYLYSLISPYYNQTSSTPESNMKFTSVLAALAATAVVASPVESLKRGYGECLCQADAEKIVTEYIAILSHTSSDLGNASETAQALLDDNYTEISDSILSLEGQPLGTATFVGKQLYINSVLNAPPVMGITTLEVLVAGCTKILWYWNFLGIGKATYEVKGFNLFEITAAGQINQTNLEFNSFAWALDTGYNITFPPPQ